MCAAIRTFESTVRSRRVGGGIPGTGLEVRHRQRDTSISYLPATRIVSTTEERGQIRILARLAGQRREFSVDIPFADLVAEVQRHRRPIAPLIRQCAVVTHQKIPSPASPTPAGCGSTAALHSCRAPSAGDVVFIHGRDTVTEVYVATISGRNSPSFGVELFDSAPGLIAS